MVESAALLVDEVFPIQPIRQWVLTVPFPLRFLFAAYPELMGKVLSTGRLFNDNQPDFSPAANLRPKLLQHTQERIPVCTLSFRQA